MDERGRVVAVWTGSTATGTAAGDGYSSWTSNAVGPATVPVGDSLSTDAAWANAGLPSCDMTAAL